MSDRRTNTDPFRKVEKASHRAGALAIMVPNLKTRWWELELECGHTVERSVRYEPGGGLRGWARHHHGPSTPELPAPKRVRCEFCGAATRREVREA